MVKTKASMKKAKNIHLTEGAIKALSIQAIKAGTNFKNYVEAHLDKLANPNGFEKAERGEKKRRKKILLSDQEIENHALEVWVDSDVWSFIVGAKWARDVIEARQKS
jgi:hypothetical protein